jgi:hypothetical protein
MGIFDSIKRSVRKARRTIVHHTKDLAKKGSEGFKDLTTKGDPSKLVSLANKGIGTVSKLHNRLANDPNFGSIYEFSNVGKAVKTGLDKAEQGKYLIEKHGDLANKAKGALDDIRKGDIKSAIKKGEEIGARVSTGGKSKNVLGVIKGKIADTAHKYDPMSRLPKSIRSRFGVNTSQQLLQKLGKTETGKKLVKDIQDKYGVKL